MAKFVLSAFADEYSAAFDEQIEGLKANGLGYIELRGIDGEYISRMTDEDKMRAAKAKLDAAGIKVSAIGSFLGKIKVNEDMDEHMEMLDNCIKAAKIFDTKNIRIFSFYIPEGKTREECRHEVMARLARMLEVAKKEGVYLCHENEKGIYGESPDCCLDIYNEFGGEIKVVFDPANFINDNHESYPRAFNMLGDKIHYMHIKDMVRGGAICPAGTGDGGIPEIIAALDKAVDGEIILTVEPHLKVFAGFEGLEAGEKAKMPNTYGSNEEAFKAAVDAIKAIIEK